MSLRILAVVPARGGSRRVGRKNLYVLEGKTLVRRALETSIAARCFETIVLSSEDPEILAEAEDLAEIVRLARPPELATDDARAYGVVRHALETMENERGAGPFDAIAVVQCTSPFTAPEDLRGAVEMLERTGAESVVSVVRLEGNQHPLKLKRMEGDRLLPFIADDRLLLSDELPEVWIRNGSVYLSRRATIESGDLISEDVRGYPMPRERSLDIDAPMDLEFAEFLLASGKRAPDGR